jgi:tetratricopeptide (TPR) repeat protein
LPAVAMDARPVALAVAALWSLHPLQTAAVTYIIQRAESLCGLLYLLTLYCFVRSVDSPRPASWRLAAFAACLAGMGTKEVMATAPLMVGLFDRVFVAGSWREAWRQRRGFHAVLMATWLLLGALVWSADNRGGSAGFATAVGAWPYLLTQCHAIVHYLRLALWPAPLVFDYGTPLFATIGAVLPQALLLLALLAGTAWALVKKPALGFPGAWFFLILAPSSSFIPVATQTIAEHRMYLPLAAVMILLVFGLRVLLGPDRAVIVCLGLALAGGGLTASRNRVYHSELALWSHTVAHRPQNARAHANLGVALVETGQLTEAVAQFEEALRLEPDNAAARLNLCDTLTTLNRAAEALTHGEAAVRAEPRSAGAHHNLARVLARLGRTAEAVNHYEVARQLEPAAVDVAEGLAAAHYALGNQAAARSDFAGAIGHYRRALAASPDHLAARANLGNALLVSGHLVDAIGEYREVLRRNPGDARVQENLMRALEMQRASAR